VKYLAPIATLEDSRRFLHDAAGLPNSINGRERCQTYLKATVVFSWLALEQAVKNEMEEYSGVSQTLKAPRKLHDRITFCLACHIALRVCRENQENSFGEGFPDAGDKLIRDRAFSQPFFAKMPWSCREEASV
jgi:hypothetical protein